MNDAVGEMPQSTESASIRGGRSALSGDGGSPLSVFLLGRSLDIGGAERQLVQLATGLKKCGYEVRVGLFYRGGVLEAELTRCDVEIVDLRKRARWDVAGFMLRLIRALWHAQPEVVYSFLGTANIVTALVRPFAPPHRLIWSVRASDMALGDYGWLPRFSYRFEIALSQRPDLIISNSRAGLEHAVRNGFPREQMVVVPNGIDIERFRPDANLRRQVRSHWGLAERHLAVGVLARIDPVKDHSTFLKAAASVAARRDDVRFLCIGDGPAEYVQSLKDLAVSLGIAERVIWTGSAADPVPVLNGLDLACSSSSSEGFSNAVAEAMACGLSCVVTDVGDTAFVVGDTGGVVPPRDPEALSKAILQALRSRSELGPRARHRIVEEFSVAPMIERTCRHFWRPPRARRLSLFGRSTRHRPRPSRQPKDT